MQSAMKLKLREENTNGELLLFNEEAVFITPIIHASCRELNQLLP